MTTQKYFTVNIVTKSYIKKYLQSLYGKHIVFTSGNLFGTILMAILDRPPAVRESKIKLKKRLDSYDTPLVIYCPMWFLKKNMYGFDISDGHIFGINKLFEQRFTEDLFKFCAVLKICGVFIEDALEEFCRLHDIELDVDITLDALKQKEYRYRKHLTDIDAGIIKSEIKPIQLSFY